MPVFRIGPDYQGQLEELPTAADKAAALEALLTVELAEDGDSFIYRRLGERLARIKQRKDATDESTERRLKELQEIAEEVARTKSEPERFNLDPQAYALFAVLRIQCVARDEPYLAACAKRMVKSLRDRQLLTRGWSTSKGGRQNLELYLLTEAWEPFYKDLGIDPTDQSPPFLKPAIDELATTDT